MSAKDDLRKLVEATNEDEAARLLPVVQRAVESEMSPAGIAYKLGALEATVSALKDQVRALRVDADVAQQGARFIGNDLHRLEQRFQGEIERLRQRVDSLRR